MYLDASEVPRELRVPSVFVGNTLEVWSDNNFMVSIAERPRLLAGECKLPPSELTVVFRWVSINQTVLMAHWDGHTSTCELYEDLTPISIPASMVEWAWEVIRATDEIYRDKEIFIPYYRVLTPGSEARRTLRELDRGATERISHDEMRSRIRDMLREGRQ